MGCPRDLTSKRRGKMLFPLFRCVLFPSGKIWQVAISRFVLWSPAHREQSRNGSAVLGHYYDTSTNLDCDCGWKFFARFLEVFRCRCHFEEWICLRAIGPKGVVAHMTRSEDKIFPVKLRGILRQHDLSEQTRIFFFDPLPSSSNIYITCFPQTLIRLCQSL